MKTKYLFWICFVLGIATLASCNFPWERTADLEAVVSDVNRYDAGDAKSYSVRVGQHSKLVKGDGVNVNQKGSAVLEMGGCELRIFRSSGLKVEKLPSSSAPVCAVYFQQGTILNRVKVKTIINTDWVVIQTIGTEFLVHLDPVREIVWVLVVEGDVIVTAAGETVLVGEGQQTWVWRGQPPEQPRPTNREEIAGLFPPLEDLTNGELNDETFIPVTGPDSEPTEVDNPPELKLGVEPLEVLVDEAIFIQATADDDRGIIAIEILINGEVVMQCFEPVCELEASFPDQGKRVVEARVFDTAEQMVSESLVLTVFPREPTEIPPMVFELAIVTDTGEIIVGECPGPKSLQVVAELPPQVLAGRAILQYQWEGISAQFVEMERIDDFTFVVVLESFPYCCGQTIIELLVEAYDFEEILVAEGRNEALLTYCLG